MIEDILELLVTRSNLIFVKYQQGEYTQKQYKEKTEVVIAAAMMIINTYLELQSEAKNYN